MEMKTHDEAVASLYLLQRDYTDGFGEYGPALVEFGKVLDRYRKKYFEWKPYNASNLEEQSDLGKKLKPALLTCAIVAVLAFLFVKLLNIGAFGSFLFYLTAGLCVGFSASEMGWVFFFSCFSGVNLGNR